MTDTAGTVVTEALRLLQVLDIEEDPTPTQLAIGAKALSNLLRNDFADAMAGFQIERINVTAPPNINYFTIGPGTQYLINRDAKHVRTIFLGHEGNTRYELKRGTESRMFQVGVTGAVPVRFMEQAQVDSSINVYIWPTPDSPTDLLVSVGKRVAPFVNPTDIVPVPDDMNTSLHYIMALRLRPLFNVALTDVSDVMKLAMKYEQDWKTFARQNTAVRLRRNR